MIILTGAEGFIGSCLARELNNLGRKDLLLVGELDSKEKSKNLRKINFLEYVPKNNFLGLLESNKFLDVEKIIHIGACSSTTETDSNYIMENNFTYSKRIFDWCKKNNVRLIYASSAATYGDGSEGYKDDENTIDKLVPLNIYGYSKHLFDKYVLSNKESASFVGLKFFNVYGPNEYHKKRMASMAFHSFNQIKEKGEVRLFKSNSREFEDGEQKRDFIYVKDVNNIITFFLEGNINGIFNVGTGKARSFNDLAKAVFKSMNKKPIIKYIDMPEDLEEKYQNFTQANISKLRAAGYNKDFYSLERGIKDYVQNYLEKKVSFY